MKQWLIHILAMVAPALAERLVRRVATPASAIDRREKDRLRWHELRQRCKTTDTEIDNILADWLGVYMKFRTPPGEKSLELRAQEALGWAFTHLASIRVQIENQPMTDDQVATAHESLRRCTQVVRETLAILDEANDACTGE